MFIHPVQHHWHKEDTDGDMTQSLESCLTGLKMRKRRNVVVTETSHYLCKTGRNYDKSYPTASINLRWHYRMEHGSWPREETCFLRLPWDPILFCGPRQGRSSSSSSLQYHGRQDVKRPMRERKQSTQSLWTFADSKGGVPGCSPLK